MNFSGNFPADHHNKLKFSTHDSPRIKILTFFFCFQYERSCREEEKSLGEKMIKVVVGIELENLQGQSSCYGAVHMWRNVIKTDKKL